MDFFLGDGIWASIRKTAFLLSLYPIVLVVYNLFFHPLAKFPGPPLWRASRIPYMRGVWSGRFPYIVQDLHSTYGEVVRIAPNELSFASSSSWDDIYSMTDGNNPSAFPKSKIWHGSFDNSASSVFTKLDFKEHARARRAMDPGFSERAVVRQEFILNEYVDLFITRIRERTAATGSTVVNIVVWLNFVMFDIIGDLTFGESFRCLEKAEFEDWMSIMFGSIKANYLTISLRHYPLIFKLLMMFVPAKVKAQMKEHAKRTKVKVDRRLNSEIDRPDIISQIQRGEDGNKNGLSREEIYANAPLFIMAGSETTVTVLTGIINHLVMNRDSLANLEQELRRFTETEQLTLAALKKLPYLNAVLNEGLRMCNPNPIGHMRISPPQGGIVSGHFVPGDTLITVHNRTLSYSDKHFHEPYAWHPERWLEEAKADIKSPYYKDDRKSVRGFGWGPQSCIGEPLAWAEMRLMLGKMLWTFDLRPASTVNAKILWDDQDVFAVIDKHPLDIVLADRKV